MNWRWPATKNNNWLPWYQIVWHGIWSVPAVAAWCLLAGIVIIGWGPASPEVRELWAWFNG